MIPDGTAYLASLVIRAGHWGYLIFFLAAALECAAFLGVLVPGELLVVFGGFLAGEGLHRQFGILTEGQSPVKLEVWK